MNRVTTVTPVVGESEIALGGPFIGVRGAESLVTHEWRRLNARWYRRKMFWAIAMLGIGNLAFCMWMERIVGRPIGKAQDEIVFYWYFCGFHLSLHLIAPYWALMTSRRELTSGRLEELLVSPVSHREVFWWLWSRCFLPVMAMILLVYFGLWIRFPWLYAVGDPGDFWDPSAIGQWANQREASWGMLPIRELWIDLTALALFALPWILKRRARRILLWTTGIGILIVVSSCFLALWSNLFSNELALYGTQAHFHPAVTLLYFGLSLAWSVGIGVFFGLRSRVGLARAFLWVFLLSVGTESVAALMFVEDWSHFGVYMPLLNLLLFQMVAMGILWLGIKWNALWYLSRKRIALE